MQYFRIGLLISLGILAASACNKTIVPGEQQEVISFLQAYPGESRVNGGAFQNGDVIGVFATRGNAILSPANYADNVRHTFSGGKFVATNNGITYPDNSGLYFKAVFPYVSNAAPTFAFEVNRNQSDYKNYELSDLMISETCMSNKESPLLSFNHKMALVSIKLVFYTQQEDYTVEMVDVSPYAAVNLNNDSADAISGYKETIIGYKTDDGTFNFLIPPQVIPASQTLFKIKFAHKTINCSHNMTQHLQGGRYHGYSIDILPGDTKSEGEDLILNINR